MIGVGLAARPPGTAQRASASPSPSLSSTTGVGPQSVSLPALKVTRPLGPAPAPARATVAVSSNGSPWTAGLTLLVTSVAVAAAPTLCVAPPLLGAKLAVPSYLTTTS